MKILKVIHEATEESMAKAELRLVAAVKKSFNSHTNKDGFVVTSVAVGHVDFVGNVFVFLDALARGKVDPDKIADRAQGLCHRINLESRLVDNG